MKVQDYLTEQDVDFEVTTHEPTYDAQHMAHAVHAPGGEVAKTVLLRANHGYSYVVAVLPATHRIDFEKVSELLNGASVQMATEIEIAEHCPDCEMGVLPPFGWKYGMETLVDESLAQHDEIVFEGNTHRETIRMKYADFHRLAEPLIGSFAYRC
jgi:Ala-tRNA(Pro) deacylase